MASKVKGQKAIEKRNETLKQLKIEYVPVNSIHPNDYNPNSQSDHDFELLLKSIHEDGFTQPIICQKDRTIIDGEHRWTAMIVLDHLTRNGLEWTPEIINGLRDRREESIRPDLEIPVVFTEMSVEQMRIATLRHNRARGSEDVELAVQVLRDLEALGALDWAQDSLMMEDAELQMLLDNIPAPEALASEEYAQAWEPTTIHGNEVTQGSMETRVLAQSPTTGLIEVSAMTEGAMVSTREKERRMAEAKTEQEKQMVLKDSKIYRLALIFSGDEADTVRLALGDQAAQTLLQMCRAKLVMGLVSSD